MDECGGDQPRRTSRGSRAEVGRPRRDGTGTLTAEKVYPAVDGHFLVLLALHHPQRLVQYRFACLSVVEDLDEPFREREVSPIWVLDQRDAAPERELNEYAPAECVGDVVVPEREVALSWGSASVSSSADPEAMGRAQIYTTQYSTRYSDWVISSWHEVPYDWCRSR